MEFTLLSPEKVMTNYLDFEKSLRAFFDENLHCSRCKPKDCCCSYGSGMNDGLESFIYSWDHYVMDHTFPQWRSISENDTRCKFLSDKGCIIPSGRPCICTTYYCNTHDGILTPYEETRIVDEYKNVAKRMSALIDLKHGGISEEINAVYLIGSYFESAQQVMGMNDKFKKKFVYTPPIV